MSAKAIVRIVLLVAVSFMFTIGLTTPANAVSSSVWVKGTRCVQIDDSSQDPVTRCPSYPWATNLNASGRRMFVPPGYCSHTGDTTNVCVHSSARAGQWDYFGWSVSRRVSLGRWY